MKVKFVRHGQTDLNSPIRKMQGISDYDLNSNGIEQAEETRDKLVNEDFDIIISSPLKRAKHTAEIINEKKNVPLILDDRIKERNYGKLEGQIFKKEYCNLNFDFESIDGESLEKYETRLKEFLQSIKDEYSDKKVLVVAHNGVISVLSCILEGMPEDGNFEARGIKNGEVKEFEI